MREATSDAQPFVYKGAVHAPVGDWSRRPIPMGLFLVIDLDELSKLFAYEKSLSTIVSE